METQEDATAEITVEKPEEEVEKPEEEVDDAEDDIGNDQEAPLKDDAVKSEIEAKKELVPFLCWEVTKEKRKKICLSCALYFGFFALVRLLCE